MIENEENMVKEIDKLILNELKEKLKIKKDKISILHDEDMKEILNIINEKMNVIFLIFQGNFSVNERKLEERMEMGRTVLNFNDKIANSIILKKLDSAIQKIESLEPLNGRLISVCLDRKLFIQNVLKENISQSFVEKYIQEENLIK